MMYIGTAGWTLPSQTAERFATQGSHLERYASTFNAVEINSSFHKSHRRETYERWAASVPVGFRFAVKIPQEVTHESGLADCDEVIARFFEEVSGLGKKLAVLLVQLPGSLELDTGAARGFFRRLSRGTAARIACEPRNPSWFTPQADALLRKLKVARVAADPARVPEAAEPGADPDLLYYRLHGSPRMYYSSYTDAWLESLRGKLNSTAMARRSVWCMFDNTASRAATANALALRAMMSVTPRASPSSRACTHRRVLPP